jgi:hypothetical protein
MKLDPVGWPPGDRRPAICGHGAVDIFGQSKENLVGTAAGF